jgi:hypothetical protein
MCRGTHRAAAGAFIGAEGLMPSARFRWGFDKIQKTNTKNELAYIEHVIYTKEHF